MTVHRAAWALRAAVVAAVGTGMLTVAAAPAYADHDLRLGAIGNIEVQAGGGSQNVQIRVENRDQGNHIALDGIARNVEVTMTVPGDIGAVLQSAPSGCSLSANNTRMDCRIAEIAPGQAFSGVAQIAANGNAQVEAGQSVSGVGQIFLNTGAQQQFNVKVNGPDQAPVVREVSGVVKERGTGEPIEGARVVLVDGQGVEHQQTTDGSGNFRFTSDDNIAPGSIGLRASKDGFEFGSPPTLNLGPDQAEQGVQLALVSTATPSPSVAPSATPTATASASAVPVAADEPASGGGFFTTMLIILGVLFVALGIGAIVLLVIRQRRRAREERDGDDPAGAGGPPPGPRGPRPGSHGVYRPTPTQVAGAGNAQTQVIGPAGLPAVGPRPALANSPTMLQRGVAADETAMLPRADGPPGPAGPGSPTGPPAGYRSGGMPPGALPPGALPPGALPPRPASPASHAAEQGRYGAPYGSPAGSPAAPGSGGGYRGERPPYNAYDQPTGRHERPGYPPERPAYPPEWTRHESEASSYGPDPYTQPGGHETRHDTRYDSRGYDPRGADPRGGYDSTRYDNRGHDSRSYDTQGYDNRGYDRPSHDSQGYQGQGHEGQGYEGQGHQDSGYGGRGYDDRGYDERGGYGGDQGYEPPPPEQRRPDEYYEEPDARPRHSSGNERRRLDWLD